MASHHDESACLAGSYGGGCVFEVNDGPGMQDSTVVMSGNAFVGNKAYEGALRPYLLTCLLGGVTPPPRKHNAATIMNQAVACLYL